MDIVTDFLVLSFPVAHLWKVRINIYQKLVLGFTSCLSLVMVIVALVRMAGIRADGGAVDIVWSCFWLQQECSIAVITVSVSAFRSLFVANTERSPQRRPKYSPSYWRQRLNRRRLHSDDQDVEGTNELPQIPTATLTGMRTVIRGL